MHLLLKKDWFFESNCKILIEPNAKLLKGYVLKCENAVIV